MRLKRFKAITVSVVGLVFMLWGILILITLTNRYRTETRLSSLVPDYTRTPSLRVALGYLSGIFITFSGLAIFTPFTNYLQSKHNVEITTKNKVVFILILTSSLILVEIIDIVFFPIKSGYINW